MQSGQVVASHRGDPSLEIVTTTLGEGGRKLPDAAGQGGHLRATAGQIVQVTAMVSGQVLGSGHDPGGEPTWGGRGAHWVGATLDEVADQKVGAAGVVQLADFGQQVCHGDVGVVGEAAA